MADSTTLHKNLTGADLHVAGYTQSGDPGSIGAYKIWFDTSGGSGSWVLKVRNAANTNWEEVSSSSGGTWGSITGTLSDQTDLQTALNAKANTSHNQAASTITSDTFDDARIAASNVTQHQASLSITESQISDLDHYDSSDFATDFGTASLADLGTKSFLNLSDSPSSFSGQGLKGVRVNSGGTALEFYTTVTDTDEKVGIDSGATPGYIGAAANDGVLRVDSTLDYTDGGDYITLGIDSTLKSNYDAAYTHVSNNGSDHSYIDQDVTSGSAPTFTADNFSDGGSNAIITTTQETNFESAYTHSGLTSGNPHSVSYSDVSAIQDTTDIIKDTHIDWGTGAGQVSADDIPDGSTNAIPTLTQESNWDTAYGWGDHSSENYLKNLVEDTTPQLGGDLDVNSNQITGFTASRALEIDGDGKLQVSAVTSAELNYLDGVTSGIQAQIDAKQDALTISTGLTLGSGNILTTDDSAIDHDNLLNFAANEHYLQTAITNVSTAFSTGILKVTTGTGALSSITDNSSNWDTAYTHSQDNTQAHSDYLINNGNDSTSGTLTVAHLQSNGTIYFDEEHDCGNFGDSGVSLDVDWSNGQKQKGTLTDDVTLTFSDISSGVANFQLRLIQDGSGSRDVTWPASVKWLATEPTWSDGGAGKSIIISFFFDGTNYWAQGTSWES